MFLIYQLTKKLIILESICISSIMKHFFIYQIFYELFTLSGSFCIIYILHIIKIFYNKYFNIIQNKRI